MIFEQVRSGGCLSYLIGCEETRAAVIVDPELGLLDRYLALATEKGLRPRYLLDTHTHADHFSATRELGRQLGAHIAMNRRSAAPFVDLRLEDGDTLIAENPRLKRAERAAFVALMQSLDIAMPQHLTEALRTNRSGGKTVQQLIAEASSAIAFVSMQDAARQIERGDPSLVVLDVREREAFRTRRLPAARNVPRGELELRANKELPDPTARILVYCQFGKISTLAAQTLRVLGFARAVALDGGFEAWTQHGHPTEGEAPDRGGPE